MYITCIYVYPAFNNSKRHLRASTCDTNATLAIF